MDAFRIAGLAVMTALLALTVKSYRPELGMQVSAAGGLIILIYAAAEISGLIGAMGERLSAFGIDGDVLQLVIKVTGIAYITGVAAEICRDSGENALAVRTEICGRIMLFSAVLPRLVSLFSLLAGLIAEYVG